MILIPEAEIKEFKSRLKSAKTRFKMSAGLNLGRFDTILSESNHNYYKFKPRLNFFKFGLWCNIFNHFTDLEYFRTASILSADKLVLKPVFARTGFPFPFSSRTRVMRRSKPSNHSLNGKM